MSIGESIKDIDIQLKELSIELDELKKNRKYYDPSEYFAAVELINREIDYVKKEIRRQVKFATDVKLSRIMMYAYEIYAHGDLIWRKGEEKPANKWLRQIEQLTIVCGKIPCTQTRYAYNYELGIYKSEQVWNYELINNTRI